MESEHTHELRFDIRRRLGAGGFGEVYETWDQRRDSIVALKRLTRLSPTAIRRFKNEFRSLAHLSHPNLAQLYEMVSDGEDWSFTMELVDGGDFVSVLRDRPANEDETEGLPYDATRVRGALRQLIRGVRALHDAGKLHRDLKPHNVLVTHAGRVVILDFGMVRELSGTHAEDPSTFVGTPHYMAPEQAGNAPPTPAADWYSVGVMLFEVLTGEYPVEGRTVVQLLLRKQLADAPDDDVFPAETPDDLRRVCQALLALDPTSRPCGESLLELLGVTVAGSAPEVVVREAEIEGPLVGRARELAQLEVCARAVTRRDAPKVVALVGPSGIGKSVVGWSFVRSLDTGENLVMTSRCWENESVPYKAFDGIVDDLVAHLTALPDSVVDYYLSGDVAALARVFPAFDHVPVVRDFAAARPLLSDSPSTRRAAFRSFRALLRAVAAQKRLVIFIDDAQWGDRDSADLLLELLEGPAAPPVFVLMTFRSEEAAASPFLSGLSEGFDGLELIELEPLDNDAALELARACGAHSAAAQKIAQACAGDPYLIHQAAVGGGENADDIEEALLHRVRGLSDEERSFVEMLTIAGRPIEPALVRDAANVSAELPHILARLGNERLLRQRSTPRGRLVEPYHDRIRQALQADLGARRPAIHLRFAETMERRGSDDPELLALHFRAANERHRSAPYALLAGDAAMDLLAYDRAARAYADALNDGDWEAAQTHELQVKLGTVLSYLGRGNESAEAFVRAAAHGDEITAIALRRRAAEQLLRAGQFVRGSQLLDSVLAEFDIRAPTSGAALNVSIVAGSIRSAVRGTDYVERTEPLAAREAEYLDTLWTAANLFGTIDVRRGVYFTLLNARETLACGDPVRVARTLALQAVHAASRTSTRARGQELIDRATTLVASADNPQGEAMVRFLNGMVAYMSGDLRTSHQLFSDVSRRLSRESDRFVWELRIIELYDLYNDYHLGHLGTLRSRVEDIARDALERDDMMQWSGTMVWGHLGALVADDPKAAEDCVERAADGWNLDDAFLLQEFWRVQARCRIALYEGRPQDVLDLLAANWSKMRGALLLALDLTRGIVFDLRARALLALAAQQTGAARARSLDVARKDIGRLRKIGLSSTVATARILAAQVLLLRGDVGQAQEQFARAEVELGSLGYELLLASVRLRVGEIQGGRGAELRGRAIQWFDARGVVNPARFVTMLIPVGAEE